MMTRRSGRWTLCKYLLALPAAVLLALLFAEPQVTLARDVTTMGVAATMEQEHAQPQHQAGTAAADDEKKKEAELALKEKIKDLKAQYAATNDPEKKQEIEKKIAQLQRSGPQMAKLDLNDAAAVKKVLKDITQKIDALKAKSANGVDAADKEKIQQELDNLSKKREFLTQRLAELQAAK